jgi:NAD(P)-dependent dehydrogenase (short-subunit alcohol dehydrogenase family)
VKGAWVVVFGRHDDEDRKLATELRDLDTEAEFVRTDMRHEEEVKNLVDKIIARFGRLDIAVNNAGTVGTPGSAADVTPESSQAICETNVLGVLLYMKYEIRAKLREGKSSIFNILYSYGKVGGLTAAVYVGSKHAVEGIKKSAAIELVGTRVRVNVVGPGPTETGMFNRFAQTKENKANFLEAHIPTQRMGAPKWIANASVFIGSDKASCIIGASPADVADVVAFLASDKARWITGVSIPVDGGSKL